MMVTSMLFQALQDRYNCINTLLTSPNIPIWVKFKAITIIAWRATTLPTLPVVQLYLPSSVCKQSNLYIHIKASNFCDLLFYSWSMFSQIILILSYIEDIQIFGVSLTFFSLNEVKKMYNSWMAKPQMKYAFFHFIQWKNSRIHSKTLNFLLLYTEFIEEEKQVIHFVV